MAEPFIGEIKMFAFNFAPRNYTTCDGQLIAVNDNPTLYSLLGTTFGGDGRTNFALPDLRGRTPAHPNQYFQGQKYGWNTVPLSIEEIPNHTHVLSANSSPTASKFVPTPDGILCDDNVNSNKSFIEESSPLIPLNPNSCGTTGGNASHQNMMPSLGINFCIALNGTYPSRN